jgi:hypothetical protein
MAMHPSVKERRSSRALVRTHECCRIRERESKEEPPRCVGAQAALSAG